MRLTLKTCAALLAFLLPAQAQTVLQSGTVTPGHPSRWIAPGVIGDGGTPANPSLTGLGVIASGPAICQVSGAITGAYNRICIGVTSTAGVIRMDNIGGATGGLTINYNGTTQGLTTAVLPVTVNNIAVFADTTGTIKDGGPPSNITGCGWRQNFGAVTRGSGLNLLTGKTQTWVIGPAQVLLCNADAWFASNVVLNTSAVYVGNIGQGGANGYNHAIADISLYDGHGCTSPCVSTQGSTATVTFTSATPTVVTWSTHGLSAGNTVSFSSSGALPNGINADTTYFVCNSAITTNTFKLSSTYTLAAAGTCDVLTIDTGSGTISGENSQAGGVDDTDAGGAIATTDYHLMVVSKRVAGLTSWGVIYSRRGCTSGPSATVQNAGYTYYSCVAWNYTSSGTGNSAAFAYAVYKTGYIWQFAGGSGSGASGTGAPVNATSGVQSQWTGVTLTGKIPPDGGWIYVAVSSSTPATLAAVAPNVSWGNSRFCSVVGGANTVSQCFASLDTAVLGVWATGAGASWDIIGGSDGY